MRNNPCQFFNRYSAFAPVRCHAGLARNNYPPLSYLPSLNLFDMHQNV